MTTVTSAFVERRPNLPTTSVYDKQDQQEKDIATGDTAAYVFRFESSPVN